eukprot:TRINITY_DN44205_c0_g1_i1.p1 TRINITY_DN44205_c0_g1~~TRINITY_DN44205_c0_g1_i1.p1  ORF type:complete len:219 (-),score=8.94 TRINITY_DN44205_c0_g1_i1:198-782(-)
MNTTAARQRQDRVSVGKDQLEKLRLSQRKECFYRYSPPQNPIEQFLHTAAYQTEPQRFSGDIVTQVREEKIQRLITREERCAHKREQDRKLQQQLIDDRNKKFEDEKERQHHCTNRNIAKNNQSGDRFNIISLQYDDSEEGRQLHAQDKEIRIRAVRRAENLYQKGCSVSHDIITGAQKKSFLNPYQTMVPRRF